MSRPIDADVLIEALRKDEEAVYSHVFCHVECDEIERLSGDLVQFINNQPTIEAAPVVHGEWKNGRCTNCGQVDLSKPNFCPNCGCCMKG